MARRMPCTTSGRDCGLTGCDETRGAGNGPAGLPARRLLLRLETLQLWLEKKKETHELVERISFQPRHEEGHETTAKKDGMVRCESGRERQGLGVGAGCAGGPQCCAGCAGGAHAHTCKHDQQSAFRRDGSALTALSILVQEAPLGMIADPPGRCHATVAAAEVTQSIPIFLGVCVRARGPWLGARRRECGAGKPCRAPRRGVCAAHSAHAQASTTSSLHSDEMEAH